MNFFQLILGVLLNLFLIAVHKSLGVPQAPAEKCLKLVPYDLDGVICVLLPLVLLLAEADLVLKKERNKKNLLSLSSSNSSKIVITLLTEVIALHVGLSVVQI